MRQYLITFKLSLAPMPANKVSTSRKEKHTDTHSHTCARTMIFLRCYLHSVYWDQVYTFSLHMTYPVRLTQRWECLRVTRLSLHAMKIPPPKSHQTTYKTAMWMDKSKSTNQSLYIYTAAVTMSTSHCRQYTLDLHLNKRL